MGGAPGGIAQARRVYGASTIYMDILLRCYICGRSVTLSPKSAG